MEVWLHTNRRALALGLILPVLIGVLGAALAVGVEAIWLRTVGGALVVAGLFGVALVLVQLRQPRLAYQDGHLLVHLNSGPSCRVPIEAVEGFLLGQGPTLLPGRRYDRSEARTLVVRLADAAAEWADRETKPALGRWCGGYITLRGIWCEPLSLDLVNRLNHRLAEIHRAGKTSDRAS